MATRLLDNSYYTGTLPFPISFDASEIVILKKLGFGALPNTKSLFNSHGCSLRKLKMTDYDIQTSGSKITGIKTTNVKVLYEYTMKNSPIYTEYQIRKEDFNIFVSILKEDL